VYTARIDLIASSRFNGFRASAGIRCINYSMMILETDATSYPQLIRRFAELF
jgi:hypothetical protein